MNLILQELKEALENEQAKHKHLKDMRIKAWEEMKIMKSTYNKSNEKDSLRHKCENSSTFVDLLLEKEIVTWDKVYELQVKIGEVRWKQSQKVKMESYEYIFENNKELTRSSETVMELEEAQTLCLFENRYQNATATIQANSSENIAKIMEVNPLCCSYYATQIYEQATDFEATKISEKKTLKISEPIVEVMQESNEKTDHCEVHQAQQFKSVMRYHDLYMKTPEVNQVIIKSDEVSVMNIVNNFKMDKLESTLTSIEKEVTLLESSSKQYKENTNQLIKLNMRENEEKLLVKNVQVAKRNILECHKNNNFFYDGSEVTLLGPHTLSPSISHQKLIKCKMKPTLEYTMEKIEEGTSVPQFPSLQDAFVVKEDHNKYYKDNPGDSPQALEEVPYPPLFPKLVVYVMLAYMLNRPSEDEIPKDPG